MLGFRGRSAQVPAARLRPQFATDPPQEGDGFELSVPGDGQSCCRPPCAARLLGMDRRTGAGVPRFSAASHSTTLGFIRVEWVCVYTPHDRLLNTNNPRI